MDRAISALLRAFASQLHPRMLALLVVPLVVAVVFWIMVGLLIWDPLTGWLASSVYDSEGISGWIWTVAATIGLKGLREFITASTALMLVLPLMAATALLIIAVFAMPLVTKHLGAGPYRDVLARGGWSVAASIWNALSATLIFIVGYLLTIPLWFIPPLGLIVPWFWWGWLTARLMRFDSLVEHADAIERAELAHRYRRSFLVLGLLVSALNYIPPLFLVTPVLSALAFGHFSLALLRDERRGVIV